MSNRKDIAHMTMEKTLRWAKEDTLNLSEFCIIIISLSDAFWDAFFFFFRDASRPVARALIREVTWLSHASARDDIHYSSFAPSTLNFNSELYHASQGKGLAYVLPCVATQIVSLSREKLQRLPVVMKVSLPELPGALHEFQPAQKPRKRMLLRGKMLLPSQKPRKPAR